jgi:hypothetical protein
MNSGLAQTPKQHTTLSSLENRNSVMYCTLVFYGSSDNEIWDLDWIELARQASE